MLRDANIAVRITAFLNYCRIEKGLAANSITSYRLDLKRFEQFTIGPDGTSAGNETSLLRSFVDSLYAAGLASRTIARHITTLRNYYRYLLQEGAIEVDPASLLVLPKTWQALPKYLNQEQVS